MTCNGSTLLDSARSGGVSFNRLPGGVARSHGVGIYLVIFKLIEFKDWQKLNCIHTQALDVIQLFSDSFKCACMAQRLALAVPSACSQCLGICVAGKLEPTWAAGVGSCRLCETTNMHLIDDQLFHWQPQGLIPFPVKI